MMGFVPPDCRSCTDALNQVHQDSYGVTAAFSDNQWATVFSSIDVQRTASLNYKVAEKMRQSVFELQRQLFAGERFACYVGNDGLEDIRPMVFGKKSASEILANNGSIQPDIVGPTMDFYIRAKSYEPSSVMGCDSATDLDAQLNKSGRPNVSRDAALVYWGMFPNGHGQKNLQWSQAEDLVNEQLSQLGLEQVAKTAFREAVNAIGHLDPKSGRPKAG